MADSQALTSGVATLDGQLLPCKPVLIKDLGQVAPAQTRITVQILLLASLQRFFRQVDVRLAREP